MADSFVISVLKWALVGFVLVTLLVAIITSSRISFRIMAGLKSFKKNFFINKILDFIEKELLIFYNSLALFKNKKIFSVMALLTLVCWFFEISSFYLIFISIIPAPLINIAAAQILAIAATLVTFIPGGLGVGEFGVVYILNLFNYQIVLTTAGALLARLVLTGTLLILGIVGSFLIKEKIE